MGLWALISGLCLTIAALVFTYEGQYLEAGIFFTAGGVSVIIHELEKLNEKL